MSTFQMTLSCDNAAFDGNPGELARILTEVADAIREDGYSAVTSVKRLRDFNGNRVGFAVLDGVN